MPKLTVEWSSDAKVPDSEVPDIVRQVAADIARNTADGEMVEEGGEFELDTGWLVDWEYDRYV